MPRQSTTSAVAPDISTRTPAVSRIQRASAGASPDGRGEEATSGTKASSAAALDRVGEVEPVRIRQRHQMSVPLERWCLLAKASTLWPLRFQRETILRHSVALRRG